MSTRTIIEVNHDMIEDLKNDGHIGPQLFRVICESMGRDNPHGLSVRGVRILGQRHHSETLELKVR
jgi:hypothetical protein